MKTLFAHSALLPEGWAENVRLTIEAGVIRTAESSAVAQPADEVAAILVPGMPNLHSHAFQRGMAGLAEVRGPGADSFWSWREIMYRFALSMQPEDVEAVASQLYVEMLEAGFTRVGEFHYLHHAPDGGHYTDIGEMAARIGASAEATGIGLTLLPVFYAHSTFGGTAPLSHQRRFINDLDRFERLYARCAEIAGALDGGMVGIAPHSLRAVTPSQLSVLTQMTRGPLHIHVAEQQREVEECIAFCGRRPVELLFDSADVDARWCLIHATHLNDGELNAIARSGAVAGLCPVTEANLGDGVFRGVEFAAAGGRYGIGSDSNVLIGIGDELRQLDYSQRLRDLSRNAMARPGQSTGRALFDAALAGGSQALGVQTSGLRVGAAADFVSLDASHPALVARDGDDLLDSWVFAAGNAVDCVWVNGIKQVEGGRHRQRRLIGDRFAKVMLGLRQRFAEQGS